MLTDTFASLVQKRELILEMSRRDLKGRGKGAVLGWLWLLLAPLFQTAVYVVVVSFVFGVRGDQSESPLSYATYVLSGMICWQVLTRSLGNAPMLVRQRMDIVKQVIYPIETLPVTALISDSFGSAVAFGVFLALATFTGELAWTAVLLPIPVLLLSLFVLGLSWVLMMVGVLIKDLANVVQMTLGLLVYLSPVVAKPSLIGEERYRWVLLNPLAHPVICFRDALYGEWHPLSWALFLGMTLAAVLAGSWIVHRAKTAINEFI